MYLNKLDKDKFLKPYLIQLYSAHQKITQEKLDKLILAEDENETFEKDLTNFYGVKNTLLKKKPFPRLPSIIGIAIVLSYYDYEGYVRHLMCKLSKVTRAHFLNHRGNLH